jgi:uncharacterized protein with HEPN domain
MMIEKALRQMRTARKLGKITNEVQRRIMRKIAPRESEVHWEHLMALRSRIEHDIQPLLLAKKQAEATVFDIRFR